MKVFVFNLSWIYFSMIGCIVILIKSFFSIILFQKSSVAQDGNQLAEYWMAKLCLAAIVGQVEVIHKGGTPSNTDASSSKNAPIFVANHASQLDVALAYFVEHRFKWIAKSSVLYLPGVGSLMYLSQHILIQRKGKNKQNSVQNLYTRANASLRDQKVSIFIFPQGTRAIAKELPFKDGAFVMAETNQTDLIPVSIHIPRNTNPWNSFYPFFQKAPVIRLTIHAPISYDPKRDRSTTKQLCFDTIYSALPRVKRE